MSAQNPFQIPTCFKLDIEQRRRERFKKTVVTTVIVGVAVVIGLLIEGCVSEKSQANDEQSQATAQNTIQTPAQSVPEASSQPPQVAISQISLPVQPCPVATVPKQTAAPAEPPHINGAAVYLVRSGDTLSRIAKSHHTTVKAIKEMNKLDTDRISVGEKLNIPTA